MYNGSKKKKQNSCWKLKKFTVNGTALDSRFVSVECWMLTAASGMNRMIQFIRIIVEWEWKLDESMPYRERDS